MSEKVISLRDRLRAKTVGAPKNFKSETVEFDGEKFVVRQPSVAQRSEIMKRAKVQTGDAERMDLAELQVWATIHCVYTEEGEQVFEAGDADSLRGQPAGSFVDIMAEVALRLMNVEADAAAKNSVQTPKGNSSSR